MTEQQPYDIVRTDANFEVRLYPEHVVAEVTVRSDFDDAGSRAFRYLFGYITGANTRKQRLAMTAPVVQSAADEGPETIEMTSPVVQRSEADGSIHVVTFVLPKNMTATTAPTPTSPEVRIRTVPEALVAVMRYPGRWTQKAYDEHCALLLERLHSAGLTPIGVPRFARYDPPYTLWLLKRNEVLVDLER